jgi:hypothetical protein
MLSVVHLHTIPEGNPAVDVGIVFIESALTKVVHALSDVIFDPTIIEQSNVDVLLLIPPKIAEHAPLAVFKLPPPINE